VQYLRTVSASVFLPRPEVDSAFIEMKPRTANELPDHDPQLFARLVRLGFSQRRKQLQKLLRNEVPEWASASHAVGFDAKARAEELSLEQWIALSNLVTAPASETAASDPGERFPIVDENDHVTGEAPRGEVHGNNLRHRAVHLLLFNDAGELFLQKRSKWKDRHPCVWDSSAAGHVDAGEEYDQAAARELREELGIETPLERLLKLPASEQTGQEFIWLYRGRYNGPFQLARSEIELGDFFPPEVVSDWIAARPEDFAPGFVECWHALKAREATA
ncbi:MAG: NUDIX domain-containing protein, partial [Verrucomicrobiota bacterium]|nr:NUDIX domain-containing protein [Verrucomicrobiota bacterium]